MSEKIFTKAFVKEVNLEERTIIAVASNERIDRDREIIESSAWKLENYLKNPVLLWAHDYRLPPIGRTLWIKVEGGELKFKAQFHTKTQMAREVGDLYLGGFLKGFSVGFIPRSWEDKEGDENVRRVFKEVELLEISAVPVPANPDALAQAINEGQIQIRSKSILDAIKEGENMAEFKGVIPFKHFPLAPEDTPWNGPREVREAEVSDLKLMCAWYDSENPDIKASYKLPHHRAKDHYTVWNGVRAAMAALFGARGGVRIPSKDRKGVYNHLSRHYKEFDKEPPEFREYSETELKEMFPEVYEMSDEEWETVVGEITEEEKAFDIEAKLDQIAEAILRVEEKLVVLSEKLFEKVEVKKKDESPADENPETSGEEIDPGEVREIAETVIDRVIRRITGRDV